MDGYFFSLFNIRLLSFESFQWEQSSSSFMVLSFQTIKSWDSIAHLWCMHMLTIFLILGNSQVARFVPFLYWSWVQEAMMALLGGTSPPLPLIVLLLLETGSRLLITESRSGSECQTDSTLTSSREGSKYLPCFQSKWESTPAIEKQPDRCLSAHFCFANSDTHQSQAVRTRAILNESPATLGCGEEASFMQNLLCLFVMYIPALLNDWRTCEVLWNKRGEILDGYIEQCTWPCWSGKRSLRTHCEMWFLDMSLGIDCLRISDKRALRQIERFYCWSYLAIRTMLSWESDTSIMDICSLWPRLATAERTNRLNI